MTNASNALAGLVAQGAAGLSRRFMDGIEGPWRRRGGRAGPDGEAADSVYDFDDEPLVKAAMAALMLGQPLVLAGQPGVGKTQFGAALAGRTGLPLQRVHYVKSTTTGRDLLYTFDEIGRFRDAAGAGVAAGSQLRRGLRHYVHFNALGRAILWSAGPGREIRPPAGTMETIGGAGFERRQSANLGELFPDVFAEPHAIDGPTRSVALVDEIDKAPRDAPNDVLAEVENMSFRIEELDIEISADETAWPVLILTSNSERSLPDAFLRRCVFHWIDFPDEQRLCRIVVAHCVRIEDDHEPPLSPEDEFVRSAVACFLQARERAVNKQPATAELITFAVALRDMGFRRDETVGLQDGRVAGILGVLLKSQVDLEQIRGTPRGNS